jgi:uncharacterized protein
MLPYRPHPWLRSGHLQTIMIGLLPGEQPLNQTRSITVTLVDGEQLLVHEELGPTVASTAPLVILLHGLGGDHSAPYLKRIAYQLRRRNRHCWRVDLRGSGLGFDLAWRPAHAGSSSDLAAVVQSARQLYPQSPMRIVGFSLSGNILLKMLGELALGHLPITIEQAGIEQAIAVAPPVDLAACADNMDRWSRRIYSRHYVKALEQLAVRKRARWPQWRQVTATSKIRTIRQFDELYTAPLAGFRDTADYYSQSSSLQWLPHIQTPTEILLDRHDPIVNWSSHANAQFDPQWVSYHHTSYGGHMGYFGIDDQGQLTRWLEYYVARRLDS